MSEAKEPLRRLPIVMTLERIEKWNGYWTNQMGDSPADEDAMEIVRAILEGAVRRPSPDARRRRIDMKTTKDILAELAACPEAVKWAGRKTHKKAWETCKRDDWLLWIAGKVDIDRKLLVMAACACARTALKFVLKGEDRPRIAIETAEAWTRGEATIDQALSAAYAARVAANAARVAANAAYAARVAANADAAAADAAARAAAAAAHAAAYAATDAAYAAAAAADAAAYAARAAAYAADAAHKNMADIVRKIIPFSVIKKAIADYEGKE